MTALTPNLQFPYATPTDPADVPLRMKELAEAIDAQLAFEESRSGPRAMAQFLGTIPNVVPGTATTAPLTLQVTDFNTTFGGVRATVPFTDPATVSVTVNFPGFWFIFGSVQISTTPPASNIDELGVEILRNGTASPQLCRSSTHETQTGGDPAHLLDTCSGALLAAGDTIGLRALVRRSAGTAGVGFGRRSLTLMRMTLS